ncbi:MAG: extracellular solute-binding protein [Lachnospiraceae bacterium]|jgi:iron(III) transport system substrate-binding protein|nr:extracellular solute-binding protein [Lachnospiraceae bacterium]
MMIRIGRIFAMVITILLISIYISGCRINDNANADKWLESADLSGDDDENELYENALKEDILIVYTVSTRATQVKESFEKEYPGLHVEIRDLRSPELIKAVAESVDTEKYDADVVICNDNSGTFKSELLDKGKVYPYIPHDIKENMKDGHVTDMITFLDEAELMFYNGTKYEKSPISNVWELTEEKYKGKIIMPSPLRSFSTYALCAAILDSSDVLEEAYKEYAGSELEIPDDNNASEYFMSLLFDNAVFSNSSDEVVEALGTDETEYDFGIMVSSKLRFNEIGYNLKPQYDLEPFSGAKISYAVMIAKGSKNVNTAKLFIRYMLGGSDGQGEGYKPFQTIGTWSARNDLNDGNPVALEDIRLLTPNQDYIIENRDYIDGFLSNLLEKH